MTPLPGSPEQTAIPLSQCLAPEMQPCVYVVLLNWNGWQDTLECIRSLRMMAYRNWRALIVDNGSTDDSVDRFRSECPEIQVLETGKNLGFAAGNNVGIRVALENGADYVFVLNNDTTVCPHAVSEFVAFAESHPGAALMGPKIGRPDPQREWPIRRSVDLLTLLCTFTVIRRLLVRLPLIRRIFYCLSETPSSASILSGSALFFRATALERVGLFDENTFLDFEELIIAEKIRRAGLSVYFVPSAAIWHKGSASAVKLRAKRYIENAKSEKYFLSEYVQVSHFGISMIRMARFLTYSVRALRYRNYREHFAEFVHVLRSRQSVKAG